MHPTTLLTFASRQIWPQVLAILNRAPSRLILFHSEEAAESSRPAARLRDFVLATGQLPADGVELVSAPATDLHQIREAISRVAERLELGDLNCEFHLTGGNKLMALAAFDWCRLNGSPCFYIERDRQILQFSPEKGELIQRPPGHLDIDLGQSIDPVHLVRCQLDSAEVVDPGQLVTLGPDGEKMPWQEIGPLLNRESYDFRRLLRIEGPEPEGRAGDQLELATAFALLKAGVPRVRRGLRTTARARTADGRDEGEQDLIFNWRGRLWVADCKDRHSPETRIDQLRNELVSASAISPRVRDLLEKLTGELKDKELMTLKQDLQAVSEAGGLMGRTLVVRREALPAQAADFARSRQMGVVLKDRLYLDLLRQLSG